MDDPTNITEISELIQNGGWAAIVWLLGYIYNKYEKANTRKNERMQIERDARIKDLQQQRDYYKEQIDKELREILEHLRSMQK